MSFRDPDDAASIPEITVEFSHSISAFDEHPDGVDDASTYAPSSLANNSSLLSPRNANFRDGRASPTVESTDGSCPPSPTISDFSSSHFPNSTLLRYNQPDVKYGSYSNPGSLVSREASVTDFLEPGIGQEGKLPQLGSTTSETTHVNDSRGYPMFPSSTEPPREKGDPSSNALGPVTTPPSDQHVDTAPFPFDPNMLAQMLDPKNIETLAQLGGTSGLLQGLGTDPFHGLTTQPPERGPTSNPSHQHDTPTAPSGLPQFSLTDPSGQVRTNLDDPDSPIHYASLEDRRRIYGENILPRRQSKSLLYLMWSALGDKVLVRLYTFLCCLIENLPFNLILLSIAAVISLALGLFQDFGTPRPEGEPPVDWVEGVAIIIAIVIVVSTEVYHISADSE